MREIGLNSSPAIMPLAALYFGVHSLGEHISLKNGTKRFQLRHSTNPFKGTCLFIKWKRSEGWFVWAAPPLQTGAIVKKLEVNSLNIRGYREKRCYPRRGYLV
jgi:hypothetical protein